MQRRDILAGAIILLLGGTTALGKWQSAPPMPPRQARLVVPRSVSIGAPRGVTVDSSGNVYFTSSLNDVFRLAPSGELTLVAGSSKPGFSGDGGPATSAELDFVTAAVFLQSGLAVDSAGNLYIADTSNHRIRKVSRAGVISTIAGDGMRAFSGDGGQAALARLYHPTGLVSDGAGNLYVADTNNNRVRKIAPDGVITTVAGSGTHGYSGDGGSALAAWMDSPTGVAIDGSGTLYIADQSNSRVRKVSPAGIITTIVGPPEFGRIYGVATGPGGVVIIADANGVQKISAGGTISTLTQARNAFSGDGGPAVNATVSEPVGVAVDRAGNVFIADQRNYRIRRIGPDGLIATVAGTGFSEDFGGDGGPAVNARINLCSRCGTQASDLVMDSAGNLYLADTGNHRVRRISPNGIITTVAGDGTMGYSGDGGPAIKAQLSLPMSIAVDRTGNLFIAEQLHLRKVAPNGTITTVANSDFTGMALDDAANLYVTTDGRVRKFSPAGTFSTIAGVGFGERGLTGERVPAVKARLGFPGSVAVNSAGTVYVAAGGGIRKITPDGIMTTIQDRQPEELMDRRRIAFDGAQNLYIAEPDEYRVRKIDVNGSVTTILGRVLSQISPGAGVVQTGVPVRPTGLVVDPAGNVYIADSAGRWRQSSTQLPPAPGWREVCPNADCILKIAPDGKVTRVAGGGPDGMPRARRAPPAVPVVPVVVRRPGTVECLTGTWRENNPKMPFPWEFFMVGNDLHVFRGDGPNGFVTGSFHRVGTVWKGSITWGNGAVWSGIQLSPAGDCHEVRTNLPQLWFRR